MQYKACHLLLLLMMMMMMWWWWLVWLASFDLSCRLASKTRIYSSPTGPETLAWASGTRSTSQSGQMTAQCYLQAVAAAAAARLDPLLLRVAAVALPCALRCSAMAT
jgi:hypothetical protein